MRSSHEVATQCVPFEKPDAQSEATLLAVPVGHLPQLPPQSAPVSLPFRRPSVQLVATQSPALLQKPDAQSVPTRQVWFSAHLSVHEPPQSTPVSSLSRTPLTHESTRHTPAMQVACPAQSTVDLQRLSTAHELHAPPPQSASVSFPSLPPFWQVGRQ